MALRRIVIYNHAPVRDATRPGPYMFTPLGNLKPEYRDRPRGLTPPQERRATLQMQNEMPLLPQQYQLMKRWGPGLYAKMHLAHARSQLGLGHPAWLKDPTDAAPFVESKHPRGQGGRFGKGSGGGAAAKPKATSAEEGQWKGFKGQAPGLFSRMFTSPAAAASELPSVPFEMSNRPDTWKAQMWKASKSGPIGQAAEGLIQKALWSSAENWWMGDDARRAVMRPLYAAQKLNLAAQQSQDPKAKAYYTSQAAALVRAGQAEYGKQVGRAKAEEQRIQNMSPEEADRQIAQAATPGGSAIVAGSAGSGTQTAYVPSVYDLVVDNINSPPYAQWAQVQ